MSRHGVVSAALLACVLAFSAGEASALINPKFTPVHLVNQSDVILRLKANPESPDGRMTFVVEGLLKGKDESKTIEVDLTATEYPDQAQFVAKTAKESSDGRALMFIGAMPDGPEATQQAAEGAGRRAFLHMEGTWVALVDNKGVWKFEQTSQPMVATWNGGTDMLERAVKYILKDPAGDVPVRTGVAWAAVVRLGKAPGKVSAVTGVDIKGDGETVLMAASDAGDHVFTFDGRTGKDITERLALHSKSLGFAWGDYNGDGRLDLASWDGKVLTLWLQDADGTFRSSPGGSVQECIGLATVGLAGGKAGLVVSTGGAPMLLAAGPGAQASPLAPGDWPGKRLGQAGPCLVADFDGDGLVDVVQPLTGGGLLYRGVKPGEFAAPVPCAVAMGKAPSSACLGDWDGDGLLDVFVAGKEACALWQNCGEGRFVDGLRLAGEISYIAKPAGISPSTGDLNNDGRQDLLVANSELGPQVFFNRGFRSFGYSVSLDLGRGTLLPEASGGQQAACLASFGESGTQDMVLVLRDGQCVIVVRAPTESDLCVKTRLSLKSGWAGPVKVRAAVDERSLGAWCVSQGEPGAFISRPDAGPVTLKWQFPGQAEQSKVVLLENKPVTVMIEPANLRK